MSSSKEVSDFLDEAAREKELELANGSATNATRASDARHDDRHRNGDRYSPRHDRHDRHARDNRAYNRDRESNGDRRRSRDRESRRREDSRPRSSKGADTTDEDRNRRRADSRDRYRAGGRRERAGGDFYDGGGRVRSRSPRRDRDDRYRNRESSADRRRGSDDRRRGRPRSKSGTPPEDDRDKRTIFVQQIAARTRSRDLRDFFEQVGPVVEAQIVKDRINGRSKGVGYVEFKHLESVEKALEKTGQKLKGIPIIVQLTEAEKNRAARPSEGGGGAGANGAPFHRLYVGNIHFSISEEDLNSVFSPYGELEQIILQRDEANPARSKGYGFVQFVNPDDAKKALQELNGFELANRQIRVGLGSDKFTPESTANLLRHFNAHSQNFQGSAFSGAGGRGAYAGGVGGVFDRTHGKDDRGVSGASALDDSDVAGVNFKTYDRSKLMAALAGRDNQDKKQGAQPVVMPRAPVVNKPMPSKCIKIENLFSVAEEQELAGDNWVKELEAEVKYECATKYGAVIHIGIDPNNEGEVYVKFDSVTGGEKAMQGLNGRSFNGRMLSASYVIDKIYNSQWGTSASKSN